MSSIIKFVDEIPGADLPSSYRKWDQVRAALRENPGRWAEVDRRTRSQGRPQATSVSQNIKRNHPDIETTVRATPDAFVVYARAVAR